MPHNLGLAQLQEERLAPCVTISAKARSRPELSLSVTGFSHVDLVLRRQGVARAVFFVALATDYDGTLVSLLAPPNWNLACRRRAVYSPGLPPNIRRGKARPSSQRSTAAAPLRLR